MAQETVVVPDIGSDAAEVVELLVRPGDTVEVDQGLVVLESDKASMEIPSTAAGTVVELLAREGDQLAEGAAVAVIETGAAATEGDAPSAGASEPAPAPRDAEAADAVAGPAAAQTTATGDGLVEVPVTVPDIGTDDAVDLVEVVVKVGDRIAEGDTLVVLESDKASMEVPSPRAGTVVSLAISEGQKLRQGDAILVLAATAEAGTEAVEPGVAAGTAVVHEPPPAPANPPQRAATSGPSTAAGSGATAPSAGIYAGPAVRRLAREFGVPLIEVRGTGPRGRVLKEDLQAYVQRALARPAGAAAGVGIPAVPEVDFAAFGPVEVVERSKIDRVTADNMQRSWLNVPHVTQFDDADITELEAFRKSLADEAQRRGTRLTPMPFLIKACAVALGRHEKLNASLSDGGATLTLKRYMHIGMAVDTPAGLLVPVLRDVDRKSLWELADEVIDLAGRARERKLKPAEMQGAGFTISSLGAVGGRGFTPIVNTPEVAILGVGRAAMQPQWQGAAFEPRLMLPLALSYDHRVVNGGDGGRFLTELVGLLGDIRRLLL